MSILDLMYESDIKLGELLALFLQGYDDKVYIELYNGSDNDVIFTDIRIIDSRLNEFINRKVIGLEMGKRLGIYIEKVLEGDLICGKMKKMSLCSRSGRN